MLLGNFWKKHNEPSEDWKEEKNLGTWRQGSVEVLENWARTKVRVNISQAEIGSERARPCQQRAESKVEQHDAEWTPKYWSFTEAGVEWGAISNSESALHSPQKNSVPAQTNSCARNHLETGAAEADWTAQTGIDKIKLVNERLNSEFSGWSCRKGCLQHLASLVSNAPRTVEAWP